jgi:hypothetical protein
VVSIGGGESLLIKITLKKKKNKHNRNILYDSHMATLNSKIFDFDDLHNILIVLFRVLQFLRQIHYKLM